MDLPSILPDPDPEDAQEVIRDLEQSRWYSPDREYEDRHFETIYGLDTRPSGKWKYDHRLGTHSILYDPEEQRFDVRTASPSDLLRNGLTTITDHLSSDPAEASDSTERFSYLLRDEEIEDYTDILQDSDLTQVEDDESTVYQGAEATVRMTETEVPEQEGRYADVEIEIQETGSIPGGEFLLERQRSVSFDGELDATLHYLEPPSVHTEPVDRRQ